MVPVFVEEFFSQRTCCIAIYLIVPGRVVKIKPDSPIIVFSWVLILVRSWLGFSNRWLDKSERTVLLELHADRLGYGSLLKRRRRKSRHITLLLLSNWFHHHPWSGSR